MSPATASPLLGIVQLDVEDGCFALGANQVLQGRELQKLARPLAVLDDPADAELVIEHFDPVADVHVLLVSEEIVDQDIVRPLERSAGKVMEWPADGLKAVAGRFRK